MAHLKQKDKILLFLLLIVGIAVGFYYLLYAPIMAEIKEQEAESVKLKVTYDTVMKSLKELDAIDEIILKNKIAALKVSGSVISKREILELTMDMKNTFLTYTDKNKTEYYAAFVNDHKFPEKQPQIKLTEPSESTVKVPDKTGKLTSIKLWQSSMSVKFFTKQKGANGIKDLCSLLEKIETKYQYMLMTELKFSEPNSTNNKEEHYWVEMSVIIYMATGNFSDYAIGTCPNVNDDGSTCMEYNELLASECRKCKKQIDNCPNANCNTLLTMDSASCHVCKSQLKECTECHELILLSDKTCSKCLKPQ